MLGLTGPFRHICVGVDECAVMRVNGARLCPMPHSRFCEAVRAKDGYSSFRGTEDRFVDLISFSS